MGFTTLADFVLDVVTLTKLLDRRQKRLVGLRVTILTTPLAYTKFSAEATHARPAPLTRSPFVR